MLWDSLAPVTGGTSPLPSVNAVYDAAVNFDALKSAPDTLQIDLPGGNTIFAQQVSFQPRAGYLFPDDEDPPETPPFWPDPNAGQSEFSFFWFGQAPGHDVILTVHQGHIIGYIGGDLGRYGLKSVNNGWQLTEYNLAGFPSDTHPATSGQRSNRPAPKKPQAPSDVQRPATVSHIRTIDLSRETVRLPWSTSNITWIDMLILWTEAARVAEGGNPNDPNDTIDIETEIQAAVDATNQALTNSGVPVRITRFHTAKLTGYSLVPNNYAQNLRNLRQLPAVQALRNQVGADMVSAIVSPATTLAACGVAHVQTHPGCGFNEPDFTCQTGAAFDPYAYNLVSAECATEDQTFTHELGHLLGGNHVRDELPGADRDAIVANGYPEAFGWRLGSFKSIMSITPQTSDRRLYFSNPFVMVDGVVTGQVGTANNAAVISTLSPAVAAFRSRPDMIFSHGFEP